MTLPVIALVCHRLPACLLFALSLTVALVFYMVSLLPFFFEDALRALKISADHIQLICPNFHKEFSRRHTRTRQNYQYHLPR